VRLYTTEKGVNAILMAVVPTVFCRNIGKNRCPFWTKEWFMEVYIHLYTPSQIVSTEDNYEKHFRIDNKTLISLIQKPSL
jgi:hypothetical protein